MNYELECDAMTWNVVKGLTNQNCVNCLFDMIGQSDTLTFLQNRKKICAWDTEDCQERRRQDIV